MDVLRPNVNVKSLPTTGPIGTIEELREIVGLFDDTSEDADLNALNITAAQVINEVTGRPIIAQQVTSYFEQFADRMLLLPEISSLTSISRYRIGVGGDLELRLAGSYGYALDPTAKSAIFIQDRPNSYPYETDDFAKVENPVVVVYQISSQFATATNSAFKEAAKLLIRDLFGSVDSSNPSITVRRKVEELLQPWSQEYGL